MLKGSNQTTFSANTVIIMNGIVKMHLAQIIEIGSIIIIFKLYLYSL